MKWEVPSNYHLQVFQDAASHLNPPLGQGIHSICACNSSETSLFCYAAFLKCLFLLFFTYQRRKTSISIHVIRTKNSLFSPQPTSLPHYKHILCIHLKGCCVSLLLSPFIIQDFQLFSILFSLEHCLSHVFTRDIHHQGQRVNIVIYCA